MEQPLSLHRGPRRAREPVQPTERLLVHHRLHHAARLGDRTHVRAGREESGLRPHCFWLPVHPSRSESAKAIGRCSGNEREKKEEECGQELEGRRPPPPGRDCPQLAATNYRRLQQAARPPGASPGANPGGLWPLAASLPLTAPSTVRHPRVASHLGLRARLRVNRAPCASDRNRAALANTVGEGGNERLAFPHSDCMSGLSRRGRRRRASL